VSAPALTICTAGHVDHGKTALVLALTGRDTDRLPQERARGLSIEPGFAPLDLPSGRRLSLVDVPGHERFVRHMVAGASGVDAYLLCVAADDGVMPQTREHLDVLALLGVDRGVVAITKSDRADPGPAAAAAREAVGPGPAVIPVCAPEGRGIGELLGALDELAAGLPRRTAEGPARLFVDRVFSVAGTGTVVTGTLWGAPIVPGDRATVLPGGAAARVRSVQAHDRPLERAAGGRVALALAGVERAQAPRGSCVVLAADGWEPTERIETSLRWLPAAGRPLRSRRRLQGFLGTAEVAVTCMLRDAPSIAPGEEGRVTLLLERPVPARAGDRLVLRSAERRTVGGAVVLEPHPPGRARAPSRRAAPPRPARPAPDDALDEALAELLAAGDLRPDPPAALAARLGRSERECRAGLARLAAAGRAVEGAGLWFDAGPAARARERAAAALEAGPLTLGALRDLWGTGRRHAEALAAHLDRSGLTRRRGDVRVLRRGGRRG
jgi:selenocysteine-specific elongation factor